MYEDMHIGKVCKREISCGHYEMLDYRGNEFQPLTQQINVSYVVDHE
jgi:hypothetical protein